MDQREVSETYTKNRLPGRYATTFMNGLQRLLSSDRLRPVDHTVMMRIVEDMGYFNIARVDEKETATALGMDARTVRASIERLLSDAWIVVERERDGVRDYLVDPSLAWKGPAHWHVEVQRQFGRLMFPEQGPSPALVLEDIDTGTAWVDTRTGEVLSA